MQEHYTSHVYRCKYKENDIICVPTYYVYTLIDLYTHTYVYIHSTGIQAPDVWGSPGLDFTA